MSRKLTIVQSALSIAAISFGGIAHAETIEFTPLSSNPNSTATANTNAYGSDANVSVGYSAYIYQFSEGYGTLDGGTGAAIYSESGGSYTLTMTFNAAAGYTVTLDSFNLATYDMESESVDISVTGGTSPYSLTDTPSTTTYTTYSPEVTGTALILTITNLYDVGLNTINYTETPASVPEPSSALLAVLGGASVLGIALRRRKRMMS